MEEGFQLNYTGQQINERLARVPTTQKQSQWDGKQDTINDLETIRAGAGKGATAVQPATMTEAIGNHNISNTAHSDIRQAISNLSELFNSLGLSVVDGKVCQTYIKN